MGVVGPGPVVERVELANEPDFDLGGARVRPSERIIAAQGDRHELQPRVMQVLVALAQARPAVVSRDRLVEQCWDGRIVGDDALNRCILALRHLSEGITPRPFAIETVPRVGHRLVESPTDKNATIKGAAKTPQQRSVARFALPLLALALLIVGTLFWLQQKSSPEPASIAVLPFRNLSDGDPHLAEGISEEILDQLAREPAFEVAGRASAAKFTAGSDPREVRRALGVDYVLEGSVRADSGRVRVSASLVKTSDGMRLWSKTYDNKLEDLLAIQSAIGQAVAGELKRRLIHSPLDRPINAEAYTSYLNARGLLRSQSPEVGAEAVGLLRQSVRLEPAFAPAWASLADALYLDARAKGVDGLIEVLPEAQAAARRALQIDPNLAQAHHVLGQLLGYETRGGMAHLQRAAELAPRTGEGLVWRGLANSATDDFEAALSAKQRAHELDPVWPFPVRAMVDLTAELGDRAAAEDIVRTGFPSDEMTQHYALARVAWIVGDFSEATRRYAIVAKSPARWARPSQRSLDDLQFMLGLSRERPTPPTVPWVGSFSRNMPRVWMATAPSPDEWIKRNRSAAAALVYQDENIVATKLMLNAGRVRELVAMYDSPTGLLGLRRSDPVGYCQFQEVPLVALALRAVGRNTEADSLLTQAEARLRAAYRRGRVPSWFDGDAAGLWAVRGQAREAVDALSRALDRGWVHAGRIDLLNLEDEPAFRSLHSDPRFRAVAARYKAHVDRERREAIRALAASGRPV